MVEEFVHFLATLLAETEERVESGDEATNEAHVDPEPDLHAREFKGDLREHRERRENQDRRERGRAQTHNLFILTTDENRATA